MKQIILVTSEKERYEPFFTAAGYYVNWCPPLVEELVKIGDRSEVIFLCLTKEDPEVLKDLCLYIRDLSIESEKILYVYGTKKAVDIVRSRVPSLYIQCAEYAEEMTLKDMMIRNPELIRDSYSGKPGMLIVDDDNIFIDTIRAYLEPYYHIYICHYDLPEAGRLLKQSKAVLIGLKEKHSLLDTMDFLRAIATRKQSAGLRVYYIASDDSERDKLNSGSENGNLALSRDTDPRRLADYFIRLCEYLKD